MITALTIFTVCILLLTPVILRYIENAQTPDRRSTPTLFTEQLLDTVIIESIIFSDTRDTHSRVCWKIIHGVLLNNVFSADEIKITDLFKLVDTEFDKLDIPDNLRQRVRCHWNDLTSRGLAYVTMVDKRRHPMVRKSHVCYSIKRAIEVNA